MKTLFVSILLCISLVSYSQIDHTPWTNLLSNNVSKSGLVNYSNFKENSKELDDYLTLLELHPPTKKWSTNERKAYWINAYNAYTVKLIIEHYPIKSIKDIAGNIYKINTPWDIKFITIGEETYDLNNIEHSILRKEFNDPRIHFAINCASISCPNIRNEAYEAKTLDRQLDQQAKIFINDSSKNLIDSDLLQLSKIFFWFKKDFTKKSSLVEFINKYSNTVVMEGTSITYLDYNWDLNE